MLKTAAAALAASLGLAAEAGAQALSAAEARAIAARAAAEALRRGLRATAVVVDAEGNALAAFSAAGAPPESVAGGAPPRALAAGCGARGLDGLAVPSAQVALAKAATAALFSTRGLAFSSRTAGYMMQPHFPPGVAFTAGGPLFGLQLSSLSCGDVAPAPLPLGLAVEPGGVALYRDGAVVGGLGVEGDGRTGADTDAFDRDVSLEEEAAVAGASGLQAPLAVRADQVLLDGLRLPHVHAEEPRAEVPPAPPAEGVELMAPRAAAASRLVPAEAGGLAGSSLPGLGVRGGALLGPGEVSAILARAAQQAERTRSALRRPLNSPARVTVAVVDAEGVLLALFARDDAPRYGLDAAVQKARTAAFFSGPRAGAELRRAGLAVFTGEVPLEGSVAFSSRAVGFLAQPFFPPGVPGAEPGPFSVAPAAWSPFHNGLQVDLVCAAVESALAGVPPARCAEPAGLASGLALAPGGVPLYREGRLAGAVGVAGDGPDQDDLIASAAAQGLEPPAERRSDRLTVRGVRLPYVKFPRHPEL